MPVHSNTSLIVATVATLVLSALFTACTTEPESDDLAVAPGFVYADTSHTATILGMCPNNLSYVAYWSLRYARATGDSGSRYFAVSVSATGLSASTWSVGTNISSNEAESPANKASVLLYGVSGSLVSPSARIRVTPFAGGDSVRIEGKNILLQNGRVLNFNLVNRVGCAT